MSRRVEERKRSLPEKVPPLPLDDRWEQREVWERIQEVLTPTPHQMLLIVFYAISIYPRTINNNFLHPQMFLLNAERVVPFDYSYVFEDGWPYSWQLQEDLDAMARKGLVHTTPYSTGILRDGRRWLYEMSHDLEQEELYSDILSIQRPIFEALSEYKKVSSRRYLRKFTDRVYRALWNYYAW